MEQKELYPPFSVAMSVYKKDNPEHFDKAIHSIWNQTVRPSEIILIVDGEVTNKINEVITNCSNEKMPLKVIRLKENRGLGNALKIAVEKSSCELIARMDSDDISVPDRFEQQLEVFKIDGQLGIVGGDIEEFISGNSRISGLRCVPKHHIQICAYMKQRSPFNHMSVMFKKKAVLKSGNYKNWPWNEDYYLWIRMLENGIRFANTGTVLVKVRVGKEMYQRRGGRDYFISEFGIQKYMLKKHIITFAVFIRNVLQRFLLQVVFPNWLRGWVYQRFARKKLKRSVGDYV